MLDLRCEVWCLLSDVWRQACHQNTCLMTDVMIRLMSGISCEKSDVSVMYNVRCLVSDVWCLTWDIILISDIRCLTSEIIHLSHIRCLTSDIGRQMSDVWCLMSKICSKRLMYDVWYLMFFVRHLMSDIWCMSDVSRLMSLKHISDIRRLMCDIYMMSHVRRLIYVWSMTSDVRCLISA